MIHSDYRTEVRHTGMCRRLYHLVIVGLVIGLTMAASGAAMAFGGIDSPVGDTAKHGSWHVASPVHHGNPGDKYSRYHKQDSHYRDRVRQYWLATRDGEQTERRTSNR